MCVYMLILHIAQQICHGLNGGRFTEYRVIDETDFVF